jgi:hypothetical protein
VKPEDRTLVRNVIYLLHACKHPDARLCVSWSVSSSRDQSGYEITALIDPTRDFEIFREDMDFIAQADPLRVHSISFRKTGDTPQLLIRVTSMTSPVMMTELDVLTVRKRRRLWGGGRS